jgi:hypothetical protein
VALRLFVRYFGFRWVNNYIMRVIMTLTVASSNLWAVGVTFG